MRIALLVRALGVGASYLWHPMERESDIYGTMYFEWGWPESTSLAIENAGMWLVVIGAIVIVLANRNKRDLTPFRLAIVIVLANRNKRDLTPFRLVAILMLAFIVFWEIAMASGLAYRGGKFMSQWALGSHGLRIAVPAALLLHTLGFGAKAILRVLYVGAITTFLVHGAQAWFGSPVFITMIIATLQSYFDCTIDQSQVEQILKFIGAMDFCVVAAILLLARSRSGVLRKLMLGTLLWMAFWGLVTAVGRTTGASLGAYPETLLRIVHLGGPLVLYVEWVRHQSTGSSVAQPNPEVQHHLPCEQPKLT